jgi:transcriptional regulator with XRE-family HTH domain
MPRRATPQGIRRRGERLRAALREARTRPSEPLSQEEVARRAGLSFAEVKHLESARGPHNPGFFTVVDLASALDLSVERLAEATRNPEERA